MPQRTASCPRCPEKDVPLSLPDQPPIGSSPYPRSFHRKAFPSSRCVPRSGRGRGRSRRLRGSPGGGRARRCPQGATPSAGDLPWEQWRVLARRLPWSPATSPSHATGSRRGRPAQTPSARPRASREVRTASAPRRGLHATRKRSSPSSAGQPDSAESVGTFWPPVHTSVCSG